MDSFTNSLNSQLQMLAIAEQQQEQEQMQSQCLNALTISNTNISDEVELPNDLNLLKNILEMRVKYTRPKHGEYWDFNDIPNDIRYLKECIKFIDSNCIKGEDVDINGGNGGGGDSDAYSKYLEPLEMDSRELDLEFGTRFYNHYSFKFIRDELIKYIESSNMEYLTNILKSNRPKGGKIEEAWIIFPNNLELKMEDYIKFYDLMDDYFKEWILEYCISDRNVYEICLNKKFTTYQILDILINKQDISNQLILLINVIIENKGSEDYLSLNEGFFKYLTYVEHLQIAIETSIPNCENSYRTIMLLMIVLRGMKNFPKLLRVFSGKVFEFLLIYPNFTLSELMEFMQVNKMPNLREFQSTFKNV